MQSSFQNTKTIMKNPVKPPIRSSVETTLSYYDKLLQQQNKGTIAPKKKKDRKNNTKNKIFNTPKEVKQKRLKRTIKVPAEIKKRTGKKVRRINKRGSQKIGKRKMRQMRFNQKKNGSKSFFPKMENRDKVAFSEFSLVLLALPHNRKKMFRAREIRGWLLPQSYDQKVGRTKLSKIKNKIRSNNKVHTD